MPANLTCNKCKQTFPYTAKLLQTIPCTNDKTKSKAANKELPIFDTIELHVCPYCNSPNISEAKTNETPHQPIEDLTFVEFSKVKDYLKEGYIELDRKDHIYAKGLVMIKLAPSKTQTETQQ